MAILEAHDITKAFPGVLALDRVTVRFEAGRIHAIMGENGAGKSTLVKILTGVYQPDGGSVLIGGHDARSQPRLFDRVAYVPQELDLFRHMTVAENLFMPFWKAGFTGPIVRRPQLLKAAVPWLDRFGIGASPAEVVYRISVSNQQLLQIARATVNRHYDILILDEPTTSLTMRDTARLFQVVRELKAEGKAIVFISHKLDELFELCDEVTVLRNGVNVGSARVRDVDRRWVIRQMSGRDIDEQDVFRPRGDHRDVVLEVEGLSGPGFEEISFALRRGEILGFAGLVGAGRSEIMQTLFGYLPARSGRVRLEGEPWKLGDPTYSIQHGLSYLPEERKQQGILPLLSVRHNIGISLLPMTARTAVISGRRERALVEDVVRTYNIRTPSLDRPIMYLSGGNQQKAIIGRAMAGTPRVLIFDEPTKGIDVGTKVDLYQLMRDLAEQRQVSIILISSDLEELLRCSNRIITVYRGRKVGEFETEHTDKSEILASMLGDTVRGNGEKSR